MVSLWSLLVTVEAIVKLNVLIVSLVYRGMCRLPHAFDTKPRHTHSQGCHGKPDSVFCGNSSRGIPDPAFVAGHGKPRLPWLPRSPRQGKCLNRSCSGEQPYTYRPPIAALCVYMPLYKSNRGCCLPRHCCKPKRSPGISPGSKGPTSSLLREGGYWRPHPAHIR